MKEKLLKPLTSKQYLNKHDGAVCPLCLSIHIESRSVDMDGSIGTAEVQCNTCGSSWRDVWIVNRYSDLNANCDKPALDEIYKKARAERKKGNFLLTPSVK